jgi:hypothetical protein
MRQGTATRESRKCQPGDHDVESYKGNAPGFRGVSVLSRVVGRLDVAEHVLWDFVLLGRDHSDVVERFAGA